ncbi:hypothetical protein J2T13_003343 [Paenibacillus sp. DS2015]
MIGTWKECLKKSLLPLKFIFNEDTANYGGSLGAKHKIRK